MMLNCYLSAAQSSRTSTYGLITANVLMTMLGEKDIFKKERLFKIKITGPAGILKIS